MATTLTPPPGFEFDEEIDTSLPGSLGANAVPMGAMQPIMESVDADGEPVLIPMPVKNADAFSVPQGFEEVATPQGLQAEFQARKNPNLAQRIGHDFQGMVDKAGQAKQREATGQQSSNETVLQGLGNSANFVFNQVPSQAIGSALSYLPEPVKQVGRNASTVIANTPIVNILPSLGTLGSNAQNVGTKYNQIAEQHPRAAANAEALFGLGNAATALAPIKGTSLAGAVMEAPGTALKTTRNAVASVLPKRAEILTADAVKSEASKAYQAAKTTGGTLRPEFTNSFIGEIEKVAPQTRAGKILGGDSDATKVVDRLKSLKDSPLSLDEAQEVDELLGDWVDKHLELGKPTKEGQKILSIQSTLRDQIANAGEDAISGGKEGFEALKEGRRLWAKQARLRDIEKIVTRAEAAQVPATALKNGFRTLYNNPSRIRGYSEAEKALIKKASESGVAGDILATFGSRLNAIGGGLVGGVPGAVLGTAGSTLSRKGAEALQLQRANNIAREISKNGKFSKDALELEFNARKGKK